MRIKYGDTIRLSISCTVIPSSSCINISYFGGDSVSAMFRSAEEAQSAYTVILCTGYIDLDIYPDCVLIATAAD